MDSFWSRCLRVRIPGTPYQRCKNGVRCSHADAQQNLQYDASRNITDLGKKPLMMRESPNASVGEFGNLINVTTLILKLSISHF